MNRKIYFRLELVRFRLIFILFILLLMNSCEEKKKIYHIGILSALDFFSETADGFISRMNELGYLEGENIKYDLYRTNFEPEKEKEILNKFIMDKVDLIFTFPSEVSLAAKEAARGTSIPVLFANANIEGVDLINSVPEPGDNITGVRFPGPDITLKRFEILVEMVPDARRILAVYQENYPTVNSQLEALRLRATELVKRIIELPASSVDDLESKLKTMDNSGDIGFDAVLLIAEPLAATPAGFSIIGKYAKKHNIPMGGAWISNGEYQSIFGVATNNFEVGKQAASLAKKILSGTKAGSIPVLSAESFLLINLKAALECGIKISDGLLKQANEVIN